LVRAARGDLEGAIERIGEALTICTRQRDIHRWVRAYVLDALCAVGVGAADPTAPRWITDLASLSGRSGMRELSVRAYLHRRDLGDHAAVSAAGMLAIEVENPHLHALVPEGGPTVLDELLGKTVAS
jgi:hypothetical protein